MSIECRPSNLLSDVRCAVCGQGFLIYDDRRVSRDRGALRSTVQQMLREQHNTHAHPVAGFRVVWTSGVASIAELAEAC